MKTFNYVVTVAEGVHARTATVLSQAAAKYTSKITVAHDGVEVNAADTLSLFKLRASQGANLVFTVEGKDEVEAAEGLKAFCEENL